MKKTAMQQLIEFMEQNQYFIGNDLYAKQKELLKLEQKQIEEAYDEGYKDAEQDKQTCGFCVEPATELTDEKHSESLDTKEDEGSELPSEKQKELLCEMMRKDEASGMYDDINKIEPASKTIKEAFENIPKEVKDRHAKAAYEEHNQLREAAEKVVKIQKRVDDESVEINDLILLDEAIEQLEKALR